MFWPVVSRLTSARGLFTIAFSPGHVSCVQTLLAHRDCRVNSDSFSAVHIRSAQHLSRRTSQCTNAEGSAVCEYSFTATKTVLRSWPCVPGCLPKQHLLTSSSSSTRGVELECCSPLPGEQVQDRIRRAPSRQSLKSWVNSKIVQIRIQKQFSQHSEIRFLLISHKQEFKDLFINKEFSFKTKILLE